MTNFSDRTVTPRRIFAFFVALALSHSAAVVVALSSPSSPLLDTKWKLRLDIGL